MSYEANGSALCPTCGQRVTYRATCPMGDTGPLAAARAAAFDNHRCGPLHGPFLHRVVVPTADLTPTGKPWEPGSWGPMEGRSSWLRDAPWDWGRCVSVREADGKHLELTFVERGEP